MSKVLQELKLKEYDQYLAALHAPAEIREAIAALFLFHHEIYQTTQDASEPMVGQIKLQWWRDVIGEILENKPARPHPVLQALDGSGVDYQRMLSVIDEYSKLLDGWQPRGFLELESFIESTICKIFELVAEVMSVEHQQELAKKYGLVFIAKKLSQNSEAASKFAMKPDEMIKNLCITAQTLETNKQDTFSKISDFYLAKLKKSEYAPLGKGTEKGKWKLILRLVFGRSSLLAR